VKIVVTCGPSYEPIDDVRRITNFSTGSLGVALSNRLTDAGHEVFCWGGLLATCREPNRVAHSCSFTTGQDLLDQLTAFAPNHSVDAVFHAAAIGDYIVAGVCDSSGNTILQKKIRSTGGAITVTLWPAVKVIRHLRGLFPAARIIGWKYEVDGTPDDALLLGHRQIAENWTDACVVNGPVLGKCYAVCQDGLMPMFFETQPDLFSGLLALLDGAKKTGVAT